MTGLEDIPPQPLPDYDTETFWEATAEGRLTVCRCQGCRLWLHPPLERCRRCGGPTDFEDVSGRGSVYSFIVARHPSVPGYLRDLPYVVALVELEEQVNLRLTARLEDVDPAGVQVGMPVQAELRPLPGGSFVVPVFRPMDR